MNQKLLFFSLLFFALLVRLYRFDNPIADWHSWRQADTSSVSRNFVNRGFDIFHPRFDDLSNVPSGLDNPNGYRFVEFPIYNIAQAGLYSLFKFLTIEEWGRLVSIFSSLFSIVFLYLLVLRHGNKRVAFLCAFLFAFFPYNVYYSRTILPDPSMVMAILGGIYFFDVWINQSAKLKSQNAKQQFKTQSFFILSILFTAAAFLLKPYALFFTLPMLYLLWSKWKFTAFLKWQLYVFAIFCILPFVGWRLWEAKFPEGIPVNSWLLNGNGIRFKPAFFRWMVYERLTKLILGYVGVLPFVLGLFKSFTAKERGFYISFLVSSLLYVCVFATGNVQHDYYQILIMPTVAITTALGAWFLLEVLQKKMHRVVAYGFLTALIFTMFYFSWRTVKDYFNINNPANVKAGIAVDRLTPKNAKVLALYDGDTSLLYQTKRQGWASFEKSLPEMIKMGASYMILMHPKPWDDTFGNQYKILEKTKEYMIVDLTKKP